MKTKFYIHDSKLHWSPCTGLPATIFDGISQKFPTSDTRSASLCIGAQTHVHKSAYWSVLDVCNILWSVCCQVFFLMNARDTCRLCIFENIAIASCELRTGFWQ